MQVTIEKFDHLGRGIAYVDGKIIFIPNTIIGDIVDATITKEKKNFLEGKLNKIIKPSQDRIEPLCPYFNECGGCILQTMSYEKTLDYKKNNIINIFKRINIDINPKIIKNPQPYNYRNKIELKIVDKKIGFYASKTHTIVEINNCLITMDCLNNVLKNIKYLNIINGSVTLRCNTNNDILVIINTKDNINIDNFIKHTNVTGIILNNKTVYGSNTIIQTINNHSIKYSYNSFFQINPYVSQELFSIVENNIDKNDKVLDLYCGVGTLSISASKAKKLVGVEIIPNAIVNAKENSKDNNNVEFILDDVSNAIDNVGKDFNTMIVDPPRKGLDNNTINTMLSIKPNKIIYVSCDPQTLVRDLSYLLKDYYIMDTYILDMFSYTYHLESICVLEMRR